MRFARNALLLGAMLAVVAVAIEAGAWLLLHSLARGSIDRRLLAAGIDTSVHTPAGRLAFPDRVDPEQVVHPYLGYVRQPPEAALGTRSLENLGFAGPFVRDPDPEEAVIGIFGGSVAEDFARDGGVEAVFEELRDLPRFAGRRPVVVRAAQGGYKQPQSALALTYLLSLGLHFDVVILLDGFNEIALPEVDNVPLGVFPLYPNLWPLRIANLDVDTAMRERIGELAWLKRLRSEAARRFHFSSLRSSQTVSLLWLVLDRRLEAAIAVRRAAIPARRSVENVDWVATGPHLEAYQGEGLAPRLAAVWRRDSLLMRAMSDAVGAEFIHLLQPNLNVPGSKPLAPAEQKLVARDSPYREPVEQSWAYLRMEGERLRASGVRFYDLTDVFRDVEEPLYVDSCCHLGKRGNELLARAIAKAIRDDLDPAATAGAVAH